MHLMELIWNLIQHLWENRRSNAIIAATHINKGR